MSEREHQWPKPEDTSSVEFARWTYDHAPRPASLYAVPGDHGHMHELKTQPTYFAAVWAGHKPFEVRAYDRPFRVGHQLRLREWSEADGFTGREVWAQVTYLLGYQDFPGVAEGYVVLGLRVHRVGFLSGDVLVDREVRS